MHVSDARAALARIRVVTGDNIPILVISDRIFWHLAHVPSADQIIKRLRQLSLIGGVLIDEFAHLVQIVFQDRLARVHDRLVILRQGNGSQDDDDRDHDHQFEQGKTSKIRRQKAESRRPRRSSRLFLLTAYCSLLTVLTSHDISLHSRRRPLTLSARQKYSLRPTK